MTCDTVDTTAVCAGEGWRSEGAALGNQIGGAGEALSTRSITSRLT